MKRNTKLIIAISLLIVLMLGYFIYQNNQGNDEQKDLHIQIQVDQEIIYDQDLSTQASTLGEFLESVKEFKVENETSSYGSYIVGMGVNEVYYQDETLGKYWTYSSSNNQECVKSGLCPAQDNLVIEDGDVFVFTLESYE